jgi:hypothetical protein
MEERFIQDGLTQRPGRRGCIGINDIHATSEDPVSLNFALRQAPSLAPRTGDSSRQSPLLAKVVKLAA